MPDIPIVRHMSVCPKITFALGLRCALFATIFAVANLDFWHNDLQAQTPQDKEDYTVVDLPKQTTMTPTEFGFAPLPLSVQPPTKLPNEADYIPRSPTEVIQASLAESANSSSDSVAGVSHTEVIWNQDGPQLILEEFGPEVVFNEFSPEVVLNEFSPELPEQYPAEIGHSYFEIISTNGQALVDHVSLKLPAVPPILTPPVNRTGPDGGLLSAYQSRAALQPFDEFIAPQTSELPMGFQPWWSHETRNHLGLKSSPFLVSLDALIERALFNSPHIQIAATEPHIQRASLLEESSQFDWLAFLESTYDDQNDPVGNTLTTGNNDSRFQQQEWFAEGGIRRRTRTGGEFELSQRLSTLQNNSQFLVPQDQGNSRLVLNYKQPLLRGRGRAVNESLVVLADINFQAASDQFLEEIQQHLTDLTETYWELVRSRSELLQRRKLLISAEKILAQLEGRAEVDALERQVFRARAAVANRKAEIARSVTSVKNAESRIRLLVNDQEIISATRMELVPTDLPNLDYLGINLGDAISTALANRPDISRSIRDVKATTVRLGVARNDVLPKLDLVVGSYVAGLEGSFDVVGSFANQFSDGRPGFNVGFEFEVPIGNRAALARQNRRTWEANRAMHQFRAVVETGLTEVELAVREVQTAHQEMQGRYYAMVASQNEASYLTDRWQTLPDESDSVTLLLENLLDAQERLADEEAAFAEAQFGYSVSLVKLKQAAGTLFQVQ